MCKAECKPYRVMAGRTDNVAGCQQAGAVLLADRCALGGARQRARRAQALKMRVWLGVQGFSNGGTRQRARHAQALHVLVMPRFLAMSSVKES